jgi:hypothetical protein
MTLIEFLLARIAEDEAGAERADYIADFNPARVLAECESKRRIVDECTGGLYWNVGCSEGHEGNFENILALLAAVYADHPDYQPKWKP